jgi:hypothetical protein
MCRRHRRIKESGGQHLHKQTAGKQGIIRGQGRSSSMAAKKQATKKKTTTTRKKAKAPTKKPPKGTCFTIMPFGGWFDDYYETIYRPAIEAADLKPTRADDLYRPGTIVNDIWNFTRSAKLVLADLTGKNPNVFYELGLAHSLAKPAILVTETLDDVPFDLQALRVLEYDKNVSNWGETLRQSITKAIRGVLAAPREAVLPTFLDVKPQSEHEPISEQDKAILEVRQDLDLMRRELRMSRLSIGRMGMSDARSRIADLISEEVPPELILRMLADLGAPERWVRKVLESEGYPIRGSK